jgi:hypothetical protein
MALIGQGLDSPDPNMRKAGTAALGVIVEGCHVRSVVNFFWVGHFQCFLGPVSESFVSHPLSMLTCFLYFFLKTGGDHQAAAHDSAACRGGRT